MIDIVNETDLDIPQDFLQEILEFLGGGDVELLFVSDSKMRQLNLEYRNMDSSTDVLSFPLENCGIQNMPLGAIVIAENFVQKAAQHFNHSLDDEIALLFIHGLLHLKGYDHEVDSGEQRQKEQEIITYFHLPESLIVRAC
ncbi:rRNA maturation RNase YbeY [Helicobacter monodelphidis]|uniref:rRNA maturation RNase YbeY n=1 Tax=Helicobacter sp. 15-1451 TaxID=2004995 RepID=UPI000DCDB9C9|nr:rRNA maturation RNase YbeY [Helicobacter sp. 15-1451]RAX57337.1 rRNA maturation RNase YbeY [Helicobacter sp. 15-1451]